jgi:hypothetical protein
MNTGQNVFNNVQMVMFQMLTKIGAVEVSMDNVDSIRTENVFQQIKHVHLIA